MASAHPLQAILPKSLKPKDYTDISLIKAAITRLDSAHHEFDVARAMLSMLRYYFPMDLGWSIVPEFLEPGGKRPDLVVEKCISDPSLAIQKQFVPKIAVELKSLKGKTLVQALKQSTKSMVTLVDQAGKDFTIYIIVMKAKWIGFFEYHNDRSALTEEYFQHHLGAVPFNMPLQHIPPGRPTYQGTGIVPFEDEWLGSGQSLGDMSGAFLDIERDSAAIHQVLIWIRDHEPLSGPAA